MSTEKTSEGLVSVMQDAIDPMTGFFNRTGFYNCLTNILALASSGKRNVLVYTVKLTNLSRIRELWSEDETKNVINASAKLIAHVFRGRAVQGRKGRVRLPPRKPDRFAALPVPHGEHGQAGIGFLPPVILQVHVLCRCCCR